MPHIDQATKTKLAEGSPVVKMGDACFLFADVALKMYNDDPSWTTIHKIRTMLRNPFHTAESHAVVRSHMGHMSKIDVDTAADLAFFEFYRLVGAAHEDIKALENGSAFEGAKVPQLNVVNMDVNDIHTTKAMQEKIEAQQRLIKKLAEEKNNGSVNQSEGLTGSEEGKPVPSTSGQQNLPSTGNGRRSKEVRSV